MTRLHRHEERVMLAEGIWVVRIRYLLTWG